MTVKDYKNIRIDNDLSKFQVLNEMIFETVGLFLELSQKLGLIICASFAFLRMKTTKYVLE